MNVLIVKLSSLGDVLHNIPIVWDIRAKYPDAVIDWVVEEAYINLLMPLVSMSEHREQANMLEQGRAIDQNLGFENPGLNRVIPIALRRWRKQGCSRTTREEWRRFRHQLTERQYDVVIETQGLIKSAFVARLAKRKRSGRISGLANRTAYSGYEPLARWFYDDCVAVPSQCHAVERSRRVAASAIQSPLNPVPPRFYPEAFLAQLRSSPRHWNAPYALLFHATARAAKGWQLEGWVSLGRMLAGRGLTVVLPWGNAAEKMTSTQLAAAIPNAIVPPAISIQDWFPVIAAAEICIGVDTGLTHLSAILERPTVEIYCDSPRWKTEGYWSERIVNLGDRQQPPATQAVLDAVTALLA